MSVGDIKYLEVKNTQNLSRNDHDYHALMTHQVTVDFISNDPIVWGIQLRGQENF